MPEHHDIVQRWEALRASQVTTRVPRADAPLGRPLREDEWIEVRWTINVPSDADVTGAVQLRRLRILRLLEEAAAQGALPTVEQLAETLHCSVATLNRDIKTLRADGHEIHTRGAKRSG